MPSIGERDTNNHSQWYLIANARGVYMASTKMQIINVVKQMDDDIAFSVLDMLVRHFNTPQKKITWNDIEETEPDAIDLEMVMESEKNPDCNVYISRDELIARRKARKQNKMNY